MGVTLRMKKTSKNGNKYSLYLDIYNNGQRQFEFLKLYIYKPAKTTIEKLHNKEILRLAETIRAKRELLLNTTANGFEAILRQKTNFFDFAKMVINEKNNRDYKAAMQHFKNFLGTDTIELGAITVETVENFKSYLQSINLKTHTQFNYLARIKNILKTAYTRGYIQQNISEKIKNIKVTINYKPFLTIEELQRLALTECPNVEVKKAFLFACNTGLRFVDIKKLTWGNIDGNYLHIIQQKTGESIYLPLNETAKSILENQKNNAPKIDKTALIFNLFNDIGYCNQILKKWAKKAEISKNLTFHLARHTFATNLLIFGADIATVSKLLGHTTLKHTQIYAKVVNSLKEIAVNKLPKIDF